MKALRVHGRRRRTGRLRKPARRARPRAPHRGPATAPQLELPCLRFPHRLGGSQAGGIAAVSSAASLLLADARAEAEQGHSRFYPAARGGLPAAPLRAGSHGPAASAVLIVLALAVALPAGDAAVEAKLKPRSPGGYTRIAFSSMSS